MILEKETFEKFGYYPCNLKPQSNKKIIATCDECEKVRVTSKNSYRMLCASCAKKGEKAYWFGKTRSKETKEKMRQSQLGTNNSFFGKHHSEINKRIMREVNKRENLSPEQIQKMRECRLGEKNPMFGKYLSKEAKQHLHDIMLGNKNFLGKKHSEETKQKMRKSRKHRIFPKYRTKPERIFERICKKCNLPFKYTGDGSFWIHNINPDFIECNGKKIAVEVFGDYWHSPLLRSDIPYSQTYEGRKRILKKYGWKLIVFWETDLKREDREQYVLNKIGSV